MGGDTRQGEPVGTDVPTAAAYWQVGFNNVERGDEVSDHTWVPKREDEECEADSQPQQGRISSRGSLQRSGGRSPSVPLGGRAPWVQDTAYLCG